MLRRLPPLDDPNVLVGTDTRDDAAVYRLDDRTALVYTTDFFTPVVDDPYDFGRVAAANAFSDVYAMGGRPLMALNLVAFPSGALPMSVLSRILAGGLDVAREAGATVVGGHSIEDREPKYGMAVVGLVHPDELMRNVGARPGDRLLLTKPLGAGVITTAIKSEKARPKEIREVVSVMTTLNRAAAEVLHRRRAQVHAVTDVTGFGLLGHLLEMLEGSEVAARLTASAIPILAGARRLAAGGAFPGGSRTNLQVVRRRVRFTGALRDDETTHLLLADAQTSGGLLAAVAPDAVDAVVAELEAAGTPAAAVIGEIVEGRPRVVVAP